MQNNISKNKFKADIHQKIVDYYLDKIYEYKFYTGDDKIDSKYSPDDELDKINNMKYCDAIIYIIKQIPDLMEFCTYHLKPRERKFIFKLLENYNK